MLSNSRGGQGPQPTPEVPPALLGLGTLSLHTQTSFWEDPPFTQDLLENAPERTRPEKRKKKRRKGKEGGKKKRETKTQEKPREKS